MDLYYCPLGRWLAYFHDKKKLYQCKMILRPHHNYISEKFVVSTASLGAALSFSLSLYAFPLTEKMDSLYVKAFGKLKNI